MTGIPAVTGSSTQTGEHLPAVEARQQDVQHHGRRCGGAGQLEGHLPVVGAEHVRSRALEVRGHELQRRPIVVHEQDRTRHPSPGGGPASTGR